MNTTEREQQIEDAKINYSAIWRISREVFMKKASETLNIPIERLELCRCIMMGNEFGKLTVYVYKKDDTEKAYYRLNNGSVQYTNLSPNIYEFENQLKNYDNNSKIHQN